MVQYNFKIEDELKERLEKALEESGAENKSDFLEKMVSAYAIHKASETDIDLSRYENVSSQAKEVLNGAFKHILTTLDANLSHTKNEAISLDAERKVLMEKEEAHRIEVLKLKSDLTTGVEVVRAEAEKNVLAAQTKTAEAEAELEAIKVSKTELEKEFANISKVADHVDSITKENKELREFNLANDAEFKKKEALLQTQIKEINAELTSAKEKAFKEEVEGKSKDKEIQSLKDQHAEQTQANEATIKTLTKELGHANSELNKSLGKLEILQEKETEK